jgi:hypothetical protein
MLMQPCEAAVPNPGAPVRSETKTEASEPPEGSPGQIEQIFTALYGEIYFGNAAEGLDRAYYSHP